MQTLQITFATCEERQHFSPGNLILSQELKNYHLYSDCKISDQRKSWAPHVVCLTCITYLNMWLNKNKKPLPFAVPMNWQEPTDHVTNLHIKLGLMKNFVKALDKTKLPFTYICEEIPFIGEAKIKEGIFLWLTNSRTSLR